MLYNAGTGVSPEYRGHGITEKMYSFGLPHFRGMGIANIMLEVITNNLPAVKVYKRIGFKEKRTVCCYRGKVQSIETHINYSIKRIKTCDWSELNSFLDFPPTWQNSIIASIRNVDNLEMWGIYDGVSLLGYLIYIPDKKRVQLFAVKPGFRRKGLASALFAHVYSMHKSELSITNIDTQDIITDSFLGSIGLKEYIRQYEMYMTIE